MNALIFHGVLGIGLFWICFCHLLLLPLSLHLTMGLSILHDVPHARHRRPLPPTRMLRLHLTLFQA